MQEFQEKYNDLMKSHQAFGNLNDHQLTSTEFSLLALPDSKSLKDEQEMYKIIEQYDSFKNTVLKLKQIYNTANLQSKNNMLQAAPYTIAYMQGKIVNLEQILDNYDKELITLKDHISNQKKENDAILKQLKTGSFSGPDLEKILQNIDSLDLNSNGILTKSTPINKPRLYQLQKDELRRNQKNQILLSRPIHLVNNKL